MRNLSKLKISAVAVMIGLTPCAADAGGWATVHRYVQKTGKCGSGKEVLATLYSIGSQTASGEPVSRHSLTAASHEYPLGTTVSVTNPLNGRTCSIRINDRGPFGKPREIGVKIDFAMGAAHCLGMHGTQYVCLPGDEATEVAGIPRIVDGDTVEISGRKIRLQGIDAPETDQLCLDDKGERWPCGIVARDELIRRFGDKPWTCAINGQDKYERSLGSCRAGSEDVAGWMVRSGWALAFIRYSPAYEAPEAAAREAQSGLWAGAFIAPWDWRDRNRRTTVLGAFSVPRKAHDVLLGAASATEAPSPECVIKGNVSPGGACIYHTPGSRWYAKVRMGAGKRWFCTTKEAEAAGCRAPKG
jgi:endonuclease YncB( thermonuclease family)